MANNLPEISTLPKLEIESAKSLAAELLDYKNRYWAIGLNGDTLQPDGFLKYFQDRNLPFEYFVRSSTGVTVGKETAYDANIATLKKYEETLLENEKNACNSKITELGQYKEKNWAIGLNGDTLLPDGFVEFFGDRKLKFDYYVRSQGLSLGEESAYENNMATLRNYLKTL